MALMQRFVVNAYQRGVILKDYLFSEMFNKNIIGASARLLMSISPSAIFGLIISMWVNSINGMPGRAWAHIFNKQGRIVIPPFTHFYAAPAVPRVFFIVWIFASALGMIIRPQLTAYFSVGTMPMSNRSFSDQLALQASARPSEASPNRIKLNYGFSSAVTPEHPVSVPTRTINTVDRRQSAVFFACYIKCSHAVLYPITFYLFNR